jgi:tight adherence protein B
MGEGALGTIAMIFPLAVCFLGLGVLMIVFVAGSGQRKAMNRRLELVERRLGSRAARGALAVKSETSMQMLEARVMRILTIGMGYTWGAKCNPVLLIAMGAFGATIGWMMARHGFALSGWASAACAVGLAYIFARQPLSRRQRQAERAFADELPDAIDTVVRMLRAGLPVIQAVRSVGAEAQPPLGAVFAAIDDQTKIGVPLEQALERSSMQIGLLEYRFFAVAVLLQHSTGGNLAGTLEMLSSIIRRRRALRMKASAATAEIRLTAYVLGSTPFVCVGAITFVQPTYMTPLLQDPRGHMILGFAIGLLSLGFFVMWSMARSITKI